MKKKKKKIMPIIIILLLIIAAVVFVILWGKRKKDKEESGDKVYVESVAVITGSGSTYADKYMGTVESQEVKYVDKQSDKTIKTVFVEEGDEVNEGDKLFEYDTDAMALQLRQLELELTSINNSISTCNQQINTLAKEREEAPAEEKIDYTTQIQSIQTQINQYNYDASCKQLEIDRQKLSIENSIVVAPMSGVIKKINQDNNNNVSSSYGYDSGSSDSADGHFISIMALGAYRIKCTGDEMNVRGLSVGQQMIVKSRTDETQCWSGHISSVDLENPVTSNSDYYYGSSSERTTKYAFYIEVDNTEGLMLGQHVYSEMDFGQSSAKSGLWMYEFYIMQDGDSAYVWAEDNGKIEKRAVTLGEYDADMMSYEILSGLTTSDYIAYPEDRIKSGMKTTRNYEDVMPDMSNDMYIDDGSIEEYDDSYNIDDYSIDGEIVDDGAAVDGGIVSDDGAAVVSGEEGAIDEIPAEDTTEEGVVE